MDPGDEARPAGDSGEAQVTHQLCDSGGDRPQHDLVRVTELQHCAPVDDSHPARERLGVGEFVRDEYRGHAGLGHQPDN